MQNYLETHRVTDDHRQFMERAWATCPPWCDGDIHVDLPSRPDGDIEHAGDLGQVGPMSLTARLVIGPDGSRRRVLDVFIDSPNGWRIDAADLRESADTLIEAMERAVAFLKSMEPCG